MRPHALLVLAVLLAGCTAGTLPEAPPRAAFPNAVDALAPVAMEGAEELERSAGSVTFLWRGGLEATVVAPNDVRVFPLNSVTTQLTPPVGAFFSVASQGSADVPLAMSLRDADGALLCEAPADGRACLPLARHEDDARSPWTLRVLADETTSPDAPFELVVTVALVEPAAGGLPALSEDAAASARAWLAPVLVDDVPLHEPSLDIAPDGTMYVSGYGNEPGVLWRSTDGGASFARVPVTDAHYCNVDRFALDRLLAPEEGAFHVGCGDVDVAVSGESVYFANHWSGEAVHASHDGGATWTSSLAASAEPARTDRAWLAADGRNAWLAFNSGRPDVFPGDEIGRTVVSRSIDGGLTWHQVGQTRGWCLPGAFVHSAASGRLYLGTCDQDGVAVATSADGGLTWDWRPVAPRSGEHDRLCYTCGIFTAVDVDDAGNVYVAWSDPHEAGTFDVWFASSADAGASWSEPAKVNGAAGTHVMPWLVAGAAGHVAVAWYGTAFEGDPSEANDAVWYVHVAETREASAASPRWEEGLASAAPVQYGPICLEGARCDGGRDLGDLLHIAFDPEQRPVVAYTDARRGSEWNQASRVLVARASG